MSKEENKDPIPVKLVIVGDGSVGKTCILTSYTTDKFPDKYVPTIFDNYSATLKVDDKLIELGIWDTAGQEEYGRLRNISYPHSDVFLIAFSVVDPPSFTNALNKWYPELMEYGQEAAQVFVGNKIDLRDDSKIAQGGQNAPIAKETALKTIKDQCNGALYVECSALNQNGLKDVFDIAIREVLQKRAKPEPRKKKGGCSLI